MAIKRSYGRIVENNTLLGFHMVNDNSEEYLIYAEQLINISNNPKQFIRIKKRNQSPDPKKNYYPGEIYGYISNKEINTVLYTKLSIHIGPADQPLKLIEDDDKCHLEGSTYQQDYHFPEQEFECFVKSIKYMHKQHEKFTLLRMNYDIS